MLNDIDEVRILLNKALNERLGLQEETSNAGFSIERLYEIAGKEDRVVTVSFREGSVSEQTWGSSLTCCFLYTERERINLSKSIGLWGNNYGKVRAKYLLHGVSNDIVEKLKTEGFSSEDVVEVLVAKQFHPDNVYNADKQRTLNQIEVQIDSQPPITELKFQYGLLCRYLHDGMLLTPSENNDYLALKLIFGIKLSDEEKSYVFDTEGRINNNSVARSYLFFKSRLTKLSGDKLRVAKKLTMTHLEERLTYLDCQLKGMGSSLGKLKTSDEEKYRYIVQKSLHFNENRLNFIGKYPIYLDYKGFIHIGLRHVAEWRFNDFFANKHLFQFPEKDIIQVLRRLVDEINDEYQSQKEQRPDYNYRKFGKNSLYLNGDYYMIHIAADGHIENFSKSIDRRIDS